jgi:hypothetical protein
MSATGAKRAKRTSLAPAASNRCDRKFVYSIDCAKQIVSVRFAENLTVTEIENYVLALRADAQFDPSFSEIVDLRAVTDVALSTSDLMALADRIDPFSPRANRAFVAQGLAQINAAQLHHILRPEAGNVRVFFSIEEAETWIEARTSGTNTTRDQ